MRLGGVFVATWFVVLFPLAKAEAYECVINRENWTPADFHQNLDLVATAIPLRHTVLGLESAEAMARLMAGEGYRYETEYLLVDHLNGDLSGRIIAHSFVTRGILSGRAPEDLGYETLVLAQFDVASGAYTIDPCYYDFSSMMLLQGVNDPVSAIVEAAE